MRRTILFALTVSVVTALTTTIANAQKISSAQIETEMNPVLFFVNQTVRGAWGVDTISLNRIALNYSGRFADTPQYLEDGDNEILYGARIDATLRKGKTSLWGFAHYDNGHVKNQKYCETADFMILYPYVMADTVGGGSSLVEKYDFLGGVSYDFGRWRVGAQGQYTAQMDYRTRDPRPKNLTGDLKMNIGGDYLLREYWIRAVLGYRHYKQTNEVKFYDEVSQPPVYHFTGLGTDYYRFRGDNIDTYYKGNGWNGDLSVRPASPTGFYAATGCGYFSFDKIISDMNQLPMNTMKQYAQNVMLGFLHTGKLHTWGVKATEHYTLHKGWENVFGSASANIYPQIAQAQKYKLKQINTTLTALYQYMPHNAYYDVAGSLGQTHIKETHADPDRLLKSSVTTVTLSLKGIWTVKRWLLQSNIVTGYTWAGDNTLYIDGTVYEENMPPLSQRYAYLSNNCRDFSLGFEIGYDTNREYLLFIRTDWRYACYADNEHTNYVNLAVGVEF